MKQVLSWKDVCKEYPKLEKIGEKYPHLKELELQFNEQKHPENILYYYIVFAKSAYISWYISSNKELVLKDINRGAVSKAGPLLVLGAFYFIQKFYSKLSIKTVVFSRTFIKGQLFFAKLLGIGKSVKDFVNYISENGKIREQKRIELTAELPFKIFEELINKEWK